MRRLSYLFILSSLVAATTLTGCGKSSNVFQDKPNIANPPGDSNPVFTQPGSSQAWNQLKSQYKCPNGNRLPDFVFRVDGNQGQWENQVSGALTPGQHSGTASGTYIGLNYGTADMMSIIKVSSGLNAKYNAVISICSDSSGGYDYIGGSAKLSNFRITSPILYMDAHCASGNIRDGYISFTSSTYGDIPVNFSSVCN